MCNFIQQPNYPTNFVAELTKIFGKPIILMVWLLKFTKFITHSFIANVYVPNVL